MNMILSTVLLLGILLSAQGLLSNKVPNLQTLGVGFCPRNQRTQLFANLWERMEIEEDEEPMWYLLNCVAGLELDLLRMCQQRTEGMDDVEKLVVPMQSSTRSHGAKRMVTDTKVKYQGYVFAKLRLTEQTYLAIQGLDLCRSWMGTVNQRGYRKLPPAPLPLSEDEIKNFGLEDIEELIEEEEEEEVIVDEDDKDLEKEKAMEEVVQTVYKGLRVGDMVKVTAKNKFFDEDGIVRRLKDNKIFLRFYTYGTMFEEWLDPSEVRKLSDEEVLRGLGGPNQPITQRDFDGPEDRKDRNDYGETRGEMRKNLYDTMGGGGQRNRRQDRNERRFSRGDSLQDQQEERKNWDWYKDNERKGRSGAYADGKTDIRGSSAESDVDSQWGRGSQQQEDDGDDWSTFVSKSNKRPQKKKDTDDFFDSLYNDLSNEVENEKSGGKSSGDDDDFFGWLMEEIEDDDKSASKAPKKAASTASSSSDEDDFFASLEMELQDDPPKKPQKKSAAPPKQDLDDFFAELADFDGDDGGGKSASGGDADDFFASLEAELETELAVTKPSRPAAKRRDAGDDFFADLESDLETELSAEPAASKASNSDDVDDFFASLEADLETTLGGTPAATKKSKAYEDDGDDFFANLESELESNDFFAELDDMGGDDDDEMMESEPKAAVPAVATAKAPAAPSSGKSLDPASLEKMTVPALKELLKDRGLKVSGKKAELIERLVS